MRAARPNLDAELDQPAHQVDLTGTQLHPGWCADEAQKGDPGLRLNEIDRDAAG